MTVVPSGRSPAASSTSRRCSSSDRVGASPVVPQTTKPSEPWRARCAMSSTNASSSTSSRSSNGVTMAVMTDPMPGTGAIIPHVVEVEARDDVRVVVDDGPWPVDRGPARRRRRAPGRAAPARCRRCTTAPVLAMTAVGGGGRARAAGGLLRHGGHRRRAGRRSRAARAGGRAGRRGPAAPRRRAGRRRSGCRSRRRCPAGACCSGAGARTCRSTPVLWHVVPSGMLEPEPDPIGGRGRARGARGAGRGGRSGRGAHARARLGPRAPAPRGVRGARAGSGSGAGRAATSSTSSRRSTSRARRRR